MKKFVVSLLFVVGVLFVIDRIGGMAMWWVNQHTHDVSGPKIKYLVNDVSEDVVLMGTSRCHLQYVPSIISDSLGMSVYNGGIDASNNIYAHYIMLNLMLERHTPKVICLDVMTNDFDKLKNPFLTVSFFSPYFGKNEHVDSIFRLAGTYWKYQISHLYRYNAKSVSNIVGLAVSRQTGEDHGYIPNPKPIYTLDSLRYRKIKLKKDSLKIEYVQRFVSLCKKRGVKLIFVVSPMYSRVDADRYDVLKSLAKQNGVPFLNYHTAGLFWDHPEYFRDYKHLWDEGARAFSSIFSSDLKKILDSLSVNNTDTVQMVRASTPSH
jgi:hypothetical protein